jgi:hypothetical protein
MNDCFIARYKSAEKDTLVLGRIFRAIKAILLVWLKNLLHGFFLLALLGPFENIIIKH